MDVYLDSQSNRDGIVRTTVRRQTGAGEGVTLVDTAEYHLCGDACSYHIKLTQNNVLSDASGVLYIAFRLRFDGPNRFVNIGGVRLTLEHQ